MAAVESIVAVPGRRPSGVASRVYRQLLADIVTGALQPGSELKLLSLAERYATSRASVRQSVLQLAAERLVLPVAPQGYRVAFASADDLLDLTKTLGWLTAIGIRESIVNGDGHWEEDVLAAHRAFAQCFDGGGRSEETDAFVGERMLAYHEALISACRSENLISCCHLLSRRALRYRNLAGVSPDQDELKWALQVRNAVLEKRTELALELFDAHYRLVVQRVLASGVLT
jgi:DNA-binding GntR family transcriptional regulator